MFTMLVEGRDSQIEKIFHLTVAIIMGPELICANKILLKLMTNCLIFH